MPLKKCMEETSHREYLAWMDWLKHEWNYPSRTDQYLMQIAAEIWRTQSKKPHSIKQDHFRLTFISGKEKPKQESVSKTKSRWLAAVGYNRKK